MHTCPCEIVAFGQPGIRDVRGENETRLIRFSRKSSPTIEKNSRLISVVLRLVEMRSLVDFVCAYRCAVGFLTQIRTCASP